jgi:hypothetical protein
MLNMYNREGEQEVTNIDNKIQKRQVEEEREKACRKGKEKDVEIRGHKET